MLGLYIPISKKRHRGDCCIQDMTNLGCGRLYQFKIWLRYGFSCGSAQEVESLGVNRSGWEAIGLSINVAMALSMP